VLVAEDNEVNREVVREMLATLGVTAEIVVNGAQATAAAEKGGFDAILMDCQMPEMNGYDAAAAIRKAEAGGARVPIFALTAHAMSGDRERAIAAGMDDYLAKPLTLEKLAALLRRTVPASSFVNAAGDVAKAATPTLDPNTPRSKRVIELTLAQLPQVTSRLQAAAARADDLKVEAHRFKGTCLSIGALSLAKRCAELEEEPARGAASLPVIVEELAALSAALEAELARAGGSS
jgi:CheY-like chemotaxis protein